MYDYCNVGKITREDSKLIDFSTDHCHPSSSSMILIVETNEYTVQYSVTSKKVMQEGNTNNTLHFEICDSEY